MNIYSKIFMNSSFRTAIISENSQIFENMAKTWQDQKYGKKYGKFSKTWHLPCIHGNLSALGIIHPAIMV